MSARKVIFIKVFFPWNIAMVSLCDCVIVVLAVTGPPYVSDCLTACQL